MDNHPKLWTKRLLPFVVCACVCESLCAVAVSTMNASCVSHVCGQSVRPYVNWPTSMDKVHSNTKLNPFWCLPACPLYGIGTGHTYLSHNKENHSSARLYSIDLIRLVFGSHINTPIYHRLLAALLFVVSTSLCPFMQNKYYKKAGKKKPSGTQTGLAQSRTHEHHDIHILNFITFSNAVRAETAAGQPFCWLEKSAGRHNTDRIASQCQWAFGIDRRMLRCSNKRMDLLCVCVCTGRRLSVWHGYWGLSMRPLAHWLVNSPFGHNQFYVRTHCNTHGYGVRRTTYQPPNILTSSNHLIDA